MSQHDRRQFLQVSLAAGAAGLASSGPTARISADEAADDAKPSMRFGLVTYQWGADWDLPTLLSNCDKAGAFGVELRTTHKHGVEPTLSAAQRSDVKAHFADSPITLVGLGSAEEFHSPDADKLAAAIESTKAFIKLSHDVGGSGVKVRPNDLPADVPHEKTIEQIGRALNELAAFGADFGQQIRLEVHGGRTSPLPVIAAIMEVADHPNAAVCWNSNEEDLNGDGLAANFKLVEKRLGATTHVHDLDGDSYPYSDLFTLLKAAKYEGWILEEASTSPSDRVAALIEERKAFERVVK
jgi:sugar phosphate isomerase/epimerase